MQTVFPRGILGPMVSPENLWVLKTTVKGSSRENHQQESYQEGG